MSKNINQKQKIPPMTKYLTVLLLLTFFVVKVSAQNLTTHTYPLTEGPDKNPMKGWNSGWWDDYELATVGFQYIKWKDIEPTDGNFDFSAVENVINRPGSKGRHLILRLHTDWAGEQETSDGGPAWLYNDYGVKRLKDPNADRYVTDYNDPNYLTQVSQVVAALATQYEDDPRIYAIQLGVLGYWGEWHTFGYDDSFAITDTTMQQVIATYKNNFLNKQLMGRYPWRVPLSEETNIGFHNDFFLPNNGHSNEFTQSIFWGKKWLEGSIGGEVPPINANDLTQFKAQLFGTEEGIDIIERGHYSTMKIGEGERPCQSSPNGQQCEKFMSMHRKMGYNFQITSAIFADNLAISDSFKIVLNLNNIGVAPMYYDWEVQVALLDENNQTVSIFEVPYSLSTILADETTYSISTTLGFDNLPLGAYNLAVRIIQPKADAQKPNPWGLEARNTYVLFANEIPTTEGKWDDNNALVGGWSILGNVGIQEAMTTSTDEILAENGIEIYPNPASDQLYIVTNESVILKRVQIYDTNGRLMKTSNLNTSTLTHSLDITMLPVGVYQLVIESEHKQLQTKFIKK